MSLDLATLAILQDRYWGDGGLTWVYDLHYTLFLDRSGRQLLAGRLPAPGSPGSSALSTVVNPGPRRSAAAGVSALAGYGPPTTGMC